MNRLLISLLSVWLTMLPYLRASAWGHANRYGGGSTYHSGNSTTRTNAYGGSATPYCRTGEPLLPTSTAPLHRMPKGLERRPPATLMAAARRIIADKERLLPARTVARQLTPRAPGIPRRPARMAVPATHYAGGGTVATNSYGQSAYGNAHYYGALTAQPIIRRSRRFLTIGPTIRR